MPFANAVYKGNIHPVFTHRPAQLFDPKFSPRLPPPNTELEIKYVRYTSLPASGAPRKAVHYTQACFADYPSYSLPQIESSQPDVDHARAHVRLVQQKLAGLIFAVFKAEFD